MPAYLLERAGKMDLNFTGINLEYRSY